MLGGYMKLCCCLERETAFPLENRAYLETRHLPCMFSLNLFQNLLLFLFQMVQAIQVLRFHLLELEKVSALSRPRRTIETVKIKIIHEISFLNIANAVKQAPG